MSSYRLFRPWLPNSLLAAYVLVLGLVAVPSAAAAVLDLKIESRTLVADGKAFGDRGAYERLSGTVTFALDPDNAANRKIVDLDKAPRNLDGLVLASANFMVLQPRDPNKATAIGVLEVSNRGGKALLPYFQNARFSNDPKEPEDFGDGLLMRQGYTLMWVGWQADVPAAAGALRLHAPVAKQGTESIEGWVRADWTLDRTVSTLALGHRGHIAYPVVDPDNEANVLTERDGREAERRVVPCSQWRFAKQVDGKVIPDSTSIYKASGFLEGKIYELVYRSKDPKVAGLGFAAVRDFMSYTKYDAASPFRVKHAVAFGVSQTGRFLRHFLYQGFNSDERDRQVFDGMFIHSAGAGRGSFNHRFAQPSRDAHRFSTFFFPTDLFPFTGRQQHDPGTGITDGLMPKKHAPKIFYTNTGYEYWGRAAALIHTTPDGKADVDPLPNERIYHLASGQHFVVPFPPRDRLPKSEAYFGNPLDFLVNLRALMVRLVDWVAQGRDPPLSAYPRIAEKTLTRVENLAFPRMAEMSVPQVAHTAYRADYGARWNEGVIDYEPPKIGEPFVALVPQVDAWGNELGGVRNAEIRVPLATYTPWCLRVGLPGPQDELVDFYGTMIPLAGDKAGRAAGGDSRSSVEERYANREDYLEQVGRAAQQLVAAGFLLQEDVPRTMKRAEQTWRWVTQ